MRYIEHRTSYVIIITVYRKFSDLPADISSLPRSLPQLYPSLRYCLAQLESRGVTNYKGAYRGGIVQRSELACNRKGERGLTWRVVFPRRLIPAVEKTKAESSRHVEPVMGQEVRNLTKMNGTSTNAFAHMCVHLIVTYKTRNITRFSSKLIFISFVNCILSLFNTFLIWAPS